MDLFFVFLRGKEKPDYTLRLGDRGMEIHNMTFPYLVQNLLEWWTNLTHYLEYGLKFLYVEK